MTGARRCSGIAWFAIGADWCFFDGCLESACWPFLSSDKWGLSRVRTRSTARFARLGTWTPCLSVFVPPARGDVCSRPEARIPELDPIRPECARLRTSISFRANALNSRGIVGAGNPGRFAATSWWS
jgi:hypothetical protein